MSYCAKCGAYMPDWADECPACGEPRPEPQKSAPKKKPSSGAAAAVGAQSGEYHYKHREPESRSAPKAGPGRDADDAAERYARAYTKKPAASAGKHRGLAALCYLGPFFLLSWMLQPKSSFVRYHVNQGLVLFLAEIVINIFDFIPFMWVANIFSFVCLVMGFVNAIGGKRKPLPLIGEIKLIN